MNIETWLAFVAASLILTMTPGPSILLGVVHSLHYGVRKTAITALGDISANFLQMVIVSLGLGAIIASSEFAFYLIKWLGVLTLVYMGCKMFFARPTFAAQQIQQGHISSKQLFWSGFFVAAGNPKAIVFFTAFFPQFIDPSEPIFQQMAIMCPTMAVLDFTWVMLYGLSANKFLGFIKKHPAALNRAGGSALLCASGFLALSSR